MRCQTSKHQEGSENALPSGVFLIKLEVFEKSVKHCYFNLTSSEVFD